MAALRCLYRRAVEDGLIAEADDPARKVAKPRRLPSTRRAVPETRLAEINQVAASSGDDPKLDTLLLRLHTETACRRGGALALRPADLDPDQCLILLREKGETVRWQPVSPTLMARLVRHGQERHARTAGGCCGTRTGGRSRPAGMTTCGSGSAGSCRGCGPSRSAPTGSGTHPDVGLQAGVDTSVIALWLGHAGVRSTDAYVHADITIKERALALTTPTAAKPGRYRPTDKMLAFLESL